MTAPIRLNGKLFTRNSVAVRLNGIFRITGIESIDWSDELPTELASSMNDQGVPAGKIQGNYGCAGKISIYRDEADLFELQVIAADPINAALSPGNLGACNFQLIVTFREDARTSVVTLVNCNVKARSSTVGNDAAANVKEYELQPTLLLENGITMANLAPAL